MTELTEIADRVWVARDPDQDLNVGVVAGDDGLLLVDTHGTGAATRATLDAVRRVSALPLLVAVSTHAHADPNRGHTGGNEVLVAEGAELVAHEQAAEALAAAGATVPTRSFSSALALDLGGRAVEVVHPGRGHSDSDVVVRVPDTDVLFAGDLLRESTRTSAVPGFGPDCFPMDWPTSLDLVLGLTTSATRIVPGHGAVVDQDFAYEQRAAIGVVAETIRDLAGRGVPLDQALAVGDWPYPQEDMADAVRRGLEQLPHVRRQLPLI